MVITGPRIIKQYEWVYRIGATWFIASWAGPPLYFTPNLDRNVCSQCNNNSLNSFMIFNTRPKIITIGNDFDHNCTSKCGDHELKASGLYFNVHSFR